MYDHSVKLLKFVPETFFHILCDFVPLYYFQVTINYDMDLYLIQPAGSTNPQIVCVKDALNTQGAIFDAIQDILGRGCVNEFSQGFSYYFQADFQDKEGDNQGGDGVENVPCGMNKRAGYAKKDGYRRKSIGSMMPRIGNDQIAPKPPASRKELDRS